MKKALLALLILFTITFSFAQEKSNLAVGFESRAQYYLDDSKTGDFDRPNRFRSNNYLKMDYYFLKNFSIGTQIESYEPMALLNYAPGFDKTNISTYYLNYKTKKLELTVGYFYEQFGSGLILRFWEDRQLGLNNALRGGRIRYNPTDYIELTGLYGKQKRGFKVSDAEIFGFDSNINISNALKLKNTALNFGFSYVGRKQEIPIPKRKPKYPPPYFNELTNSFSARLNFAEGNFSANTEFVTKSKDGLVIFDKIRNAKKGSAFLLNLGYSKKGLGISTSFRRLENMPFYSDRKATGNDYNQSIINYLPGLTKQYDYLLTNIYVYPAQAQVSFPDPEVIQFGEIGGQADIFYTIKKRTALGGKYGTKITMNTSFWYGLKGESNFSKFDYNASTLGFGKKYYSDLSLEVRKKWSKRWRGILFYLNQFYNKRYLEGEPIKVKTNILVAEATYKMNKRKSFRFEIQHLWADKDKRNWAGATVEFNTNTHLAFYINDIYNYGNELATEKIHYYNVGASYVTGANRFSLSYGRQRGGLLCVGGICRVVPKSTGISASILMSF